MVDGDTVLKGNKISKQFQGGIYEEISQLRRAIWALLVLANPEEFTTEEVAKAHLIKQELLALHEQIETLVEQS